MFYKLFEQITDVVYDSISAQSEMSREYRQLTNPILNDKLLGMNSATTTASSRPTYGNDTVLTPKLPTVQDQTYIELVRIALCYFMAKADGVTEDEQAKIDAMCERFIDDPNTSNDMRAELRIILADRSKSFAGLRRYANRVDPEVLAQFKADMRDIGETSNGVSDEERQAMKIFLDYLDSRKGPKDTTGQEVKPRPVSVQCPGCAAVLDFASAQNLTFCPYCGSRNLSVKNN
ncbi:MAG: hypothetical protein J6Y08_00070 [Clostridiales bacterium]|nr:hypothetical protein [Clostridiales bacterium]